MRTGSEMRALKNTEQREGVTCSKLLISEILLSRLSVRQLGLAESFLEKSCNILAQILALLL